MKPQSSKQLAADVNGVRPVIAFFAMIASVMFICEGMAWLGLPAFVISIIPLMHYRT